MVERFNGRVQREVLGVTVAGHRDLERLLEGFNQAYNARRQRVLDGRSPEEVVRERLAQERGLANPGYRPPSDPCVLPRAMLVIERAKDVSHPDTRRVSRRSAPPPGRPASRLPRPPASCPRGAAWARGGPPRGRPRASPRASVRRPGSASRSRTGGP